MKNKNLTSKLTLLFAGVSGTVAMAVTVQSIDFSGIGRNSEIEIIGSAPLFYSQEKGEKDQIVLKVQGQLSSSVKKQIDGSMFEFSPVRQITSYTDPSNPKESKVVVQLQKDVDDMDVHQEGNAIKIRIPNNVVPKTASIKDALKTSSSAETPAEPAGAPQTVDQPPADNPPDPLADVPPASTSPPSASTPPETVKSVEPDPVISTPNSNSNDGGTKAAAAMDEFVRNRDTKSFTGRPITLKVKDADLVDVFRLIGDTSGFNIVISDAVKGKLTMNMEGVPWDQVLDVILRTHQLGAERNGNLLRVTTLADLTNEKTQELNARKASEAIAPKVTKLFSISYANIDELSKVLTSFTQSPAASSTGVASAPAVVQTDKRTNTIIVRDTSDNLEKMKKLVELLDTQTPQVMIEAKIIEATEGFGKTIDGAFGFAHADDFGRTNWLGGFNSTGNGGGLPALAGTTTNLAVGGHSAQFGFSPKIGGFLSGLTATALLNLEENEDNAKVISSPKTVVLDHESANILSTHPVAVPVAVSSTGGAATTQDPTEIKDAKLSMQVTPSVTNEGSVMLQLTLSRDDPEPAAGGGGKFGIAQRNMSTKVIVDSGTTLVIGGIYTYKTTFTGSGLPFLRKLPLIGSLFGKEINTSNKTELIFFITPRIINPREAGLNG